MPSFLLGEVPAMLATSRPQCRTSTVDARRVIENVANRDDVHLPPQAFMRGVDTYPLKGFQHVVLFHRRSRLFIPLARLKTPPKWIPIIASIFTRGPAGTDG